MLAALDVAHAWPQFLPGGRRLLYQIVSPDTGRAGVYVASLDTRESARLLDKPAAASASMWASHWTVPGATRVPVAPTTSTATEKRTAPFSPARSTSRPPPATPPPAGHGAILPAELDHPVPDLVVQLRHRVPCDDQRHHEDDRDDGEADREPRAQGHVQCGVVRVMKRDDGGKSLPPFNPK